MRYELTDHEWTAIKPMLPNKPRGVARVNDRRVLNGIFWVLRSGPPWRDLPESFGPYTTRYNRFVRRRRAGVWSDTLCADHCPVLLFTLGGFGFSIAQYSGAGRVIFGRLSKYAFKLATSTRVRGQIFGPRFSCRRSDA